VKEVSQEREKGRKVYNRRALTSGCCTKREKRSRGEGKEGRKGKGRSILSIAIETLKKKEGRSSTNCVLTGRANRKREVK